MAYVEIPCPAGGACTYVTPKQPIAFAMEVLAMHKEIAHGQGSSVAPGVKPEKFPCPVCSLSWTFNYGVLPPRKCMKCRQCALKGDCSEGHLLHSLRGQVEL